MCASLSRGAVVIATARLTIPLQRWAAAIDVPGQRPSHANPTLRGGAPIAPGLVAGIALMHSTAWVHTWSRSPGSGDRGRRAPARTVRSRPFRTEGRGERQGNLLAEGPSSGFR